MGQPLLLTVAVTCFISYPALRCLSFKQNFSMLKFSMSVNNFQLNCRWKWMNHRLLLTSETERPFLNCFHSSDCGYLPYFNIFWSTAVSGSSVPEWVEFVVVWLPTSNGFLNCIFYFWINRNFRRKFHLVVQRLTLAICPELADSLGCTRTSTAQFVSGFLDNNNSVHERSSSVSSTCTLLTLA